MFIIPYFIETKTVENFTLKKAWIFMTKGGTKFWETDEPSLTQKELVNLYLHPNGFYGKMKSVKENIVYFEIDSKATHMADFYTWTDFLEKGEPIPQNLDVWRPFLWLGDKEKEKDEWGWEVEVKQTIIQKFWSEV
uniref:Uncharacterized protein n=1 Tax=viral metagenome TaxID=1070528 RepID=A0A6C0KLR3_9ZZZZ